MRKLFIPIAIIIVLIIFIIVLFSGGNDAPQTENNTDTTTTTTTASKDKTTSTNSVSSDIIYYQTVEPSLGVPSKTTSDPNTPGVSIYWVKEGEAGGQNTCTLYDNETQQVYASRYMGSKTLGISGTGTVYYTNDVIKQDKSFSLLNSLCFK